MAKRPQQPSTPPVPVVADGYHERWLLCCCRQLTWKGCPQQVVRMTERLDWRRIGERQMAHSQEADEREADAGVADARRGVRCGLDAGRPCGLGMLLA